MFEAHVLSSVMKIFQMSSLEDTPNFETFDNSFLESSPERKLEVFLSSIKNVITMYTHRFNLDSMGRETDHVLAYGKELLSLGLLYNEFTDAIKEGDGLRILRCWKYMLLIFMVTDKRKYSIQAADLLIKMKYLFTDRMNHQITWSRTQSTHLAGLEEIYQWIYIKNI